MLKPSQNIWQKIKSSLVPHEISPPVKAILVLFYVSIFTVGIDLSKDMAKGEFEFFEGVLTETQTIDTFAYLDFMITDPPFIGEVQEILYIPPTSDVVKLYQSRAPPVLPLI